MSANICDPATPNTLAACASARLIARTVSAIYPGADTPANWLRGDSVTDDHRALVARYLVNVNVRSVAYRYGEPVESLPGYVYPDWTDKTTYRPMPTESAHLYAPTKLAEFYTFTGDGGFGPAKVAACRRVLGVACAYEYQACELPEYSTSPAAAFIRSLIEEVGRYLSDGWELDGSEDSRREWLQAGRPVTA